jgi:3-methyladenine DNA glycosylase AlkD
MRGNSKIVTVKVIRESLRKLADPEIAVHSSRYFKTGKGEYGEGDIFLGIRVPVIRKHVRHYSAASLKEISVILKSPYHEERLFALLSLVEKFRKGGTADKTAIYRLYLGNTRYINNWDLVDTSASHIVGAYLEERSRKPLYRLAASKTLWERRIAIISTFHMIRRDDFEDAINIAGMAMNDREDLIHKAAGWMLREIGNRNLRVEKSFLNMYGQAMPRTMLRYAIEKFPARERKRYLHREGAGRDTQRRR